MNPLLFLALAGDPKWSCFGYDTGPKVGVLLSACAELHLAAVCVVIPHSPK